MLKRTKWKVEFCKNGQDYVTKPVYYNADYDCYGVNAGGRRGFVEFTRLGSWWWLGDYQAENVPDELDAILEAALG